MKIIVLGDVGVGKTTTILVLKTGKRDDGQGRIKKKSSNEMCPNRKRVLHYYTLGIDFVFDLFRENDEASIMFWSMDEEIK